MKKKTPTYCAQCYNGPDLLNMVAEDGILHSLEPNPRCSDISPAEGKICVKAFGLIQKVYNPERIKTPLLRTNPKKGKDEDPGWKAISWDEALDLLAEKLLEARAKGLEDPLVEKGRNVHRRCGQEDPAAPRLGPEDPRRVLAQFEELEVGVECFATAFLAISSGDLDAARAELATLDMQINDAEVLSVEDGLHESETAISEDDYLLATIIAQEIEALLLFRDGDSDAAVEIMTSVAEYENARAMYYGPPHVPKPPGELLGEMYLTLERPEEAAAYFEASLNRNTSRSMALLGLARAQEAIGDPRAAQTWQALDSNWQGDSSGIRGRQYGWLSN